MMTQQQRKELKEQIVAYRKEGHVIRECCERFGVTKGYVKYVCLGIDYPWARDTEAMRQAAIKQNMDRTPDEQVAIRMIARKAPGFEYVSGYTSHTGTVTIKCKGCGNVIVRTFWSVKQGHVTCVDCKRKDTEQKHERKRQFRKIERRLTKPSIRQTKQDEFKVCPVCGNLFFGGLRYCSDECRKRVASAKKYAARRIRVRDQMVDKGINLRRLYQRDEGKCYLCGIICDWNDYTNAGAFIAGGTYPTIEHVVPLSRGGIHAWSNVKLACFACNTKKGVKMA